MADVQVEIPGIGTVTAKNAATESTLRELVKALGGKSGPGKTGGGGGSGGPPTAQMGKFSQEIEDATKDVGGFGKSVAKAAKNVAKFGSALLIGSVGAAYEFGKAALFGSDRMSHLASAVPIVGGVLGDLAGIIDSNVDNFRNLASVGASFGNNIFGLQRAAANAGLSAEKFGTLLTENAESLTIFGSSSTAGAQRIGQLTKQLRTGKVGENLMAMGMSMENINEGFINYSELMARQGRLNTMSNAELVSGSASYLKNLDRLSKVTGRQREELEKAMQAAMTDGKVRLMASKLSGEELNNFNSNLAFLETTVPGLKDTFIDLADGVAQTEEAQMLMATQAGKSAMKLAQDFAAGKVGPEEFNNRLAKLGPELDGFFGGFTQAQLQALQETNPALYNLATAAGSLNRLQEKSADQISKEQAQRDKLSTVSANFEQTMNSLRSLIFDKILNSAVFQKLSDTFAKLVPTGDGVNSIFEKLEPTIDKVLGFFDRFVTDITSGKPIGEVIGKYLGEAFAGIKDTVLGFFGGSGKDGGKGGGIMGAIFDAITPPADVIALIGVSLVGALAAVGLAIGAFGAGPVAIGAAVLTGLLIGTGAAIALAGKGISMAGDGIERVAAGVERMAAVKDTANLKDVAQALGQLGPALISLTAGGVLDSIVSFFGGDSPFEKIAKGVSAFSDVDATALANMKATGTALSAFSDFSDINADGVEDFASAVGNLTDELKGLNTELNKSNSSLFGGDKASAGELLKGISGSSSGSKDSLDNLNNTMLRIEMLLSQGNRTAKATQQSVANAGDLTGAG